MRLALAKRTGSRGFFHIPVDYPGETFFLLGGGPSIRNITVSHLPQYGRVIAINNAYLLCPTALILYHCDANWLRLGVPTDLLPTASSLAGEPIPPGARHSYVVPKVFRGKYRISMGTNENGTRRVRNGGLTGLSSLPDALAHGSNSGYQAIDLAVHFGAAKIILLGYDMHCLPDRTHFHDGHGQGQTPKTYDLRLRRDLVPRFSTLVDPLRSRGVEVINCTPDSALHQWSFSPLDEVLLKL